MNNCLLLSASPRRRGPAPVTAERLLAEIERDQRATGACTATTEELAQRVGRHPRHVQETLRLLDEQHLVIRDFLPNPARRGKVLRRLRLP